MSTKTKSKRTRSHAIVPRHEMNEIRITELRGWIRCALNWGASMDSTDSREAYARRLETVCGVLEMAFEIDDAYFARIRQNPVQRKQIKGGAK